MSNYSITRHSVLFYFIKATTQVFASVFLVIYHSLCEVLVSDQKLVLFLLRKTCDCYLASLTLITYKVAVHLNAR